jgi:hypothetical protein
VVRSDRLACRAAATAGIIRAMRALRLLRIFCELGLVTVVLWGLAAVALVLVGWAHGGEAVLIFAALLLWAAFRWAVPIVDWIERRFWDARPPQPSRLGRFWNARGW